MTPSVLVKDNVFPICTIQLVLYRLSTIYVLYWILYNLTILVPNRHHPWRSSDYCVNHKRLWALAYSLHNLIIHL